MKTIENLRYANGLLSWNNIHPEKKPAMVGLIRRGLAIRRKADEAFFLTEKGQNHLFQFQIKNAEHNT